MNSRQEITEKLKEALRESCDDALHFSDDETHLIDAEYLLTVNAAKSIQKLNICFGTPYKIRLEHDTSKISTACTPPLKNLSGYKSILKNLAIIQTGMAK